MLNVAKKKEEYHVKGKGIFKRYNGNMRWGGSFFVIPKTQNSWDHSPASDSGPLKPGNLKAL